MKNPLEIYLNDHLAGSASGVLLVKRLEQTATEASEKLFFIDLREQIVEDREMLMLVIRKSGMKVSVFRNFCGLFCTWLAMWKMRISGMDVGELGRYEMIELLTMGIHGKSLLWKTMGRVVEPYDQWCCYKKLETRAEEQYSSIEIYRVQQGKLLFGDFAGEVG